MITMGLATITCCVLIGFCFLATWAGFAEYRRPLVTSHRWTGGTHRSTHRTLHPIGRWT